MRGPRLASVCVLAGAVTACGGGESTEAQVGGIAVVDAWARPTPAGVDTSAFYVTLENRGAGSDRLTGAESGRCTALAPHMTEIVDGVASMSEAVGDRLRLSPGGRIEMEPLGMHLMCFGLTEPLAAGDTVGVSLRFAEHPPLTVDLTIEQR